MPNRDYGPDREPSGRERQRLLRIVCYEGAICWLCQGVKGPIIWGLRRAHPLGPSMDHVIPRSHGGYWYLENLRPAHYGCNSARGNREPPHRVKVRSRIW